MNNKTPDYIYKFIDFINKNIPKEHNCYPLMPLPNIIWNKNLDNIVDAVGYYHLNNHTISITEKGACLNEKEIFSILLHEMTHAYEYFINKETNHNCLFQKIHDGIRNNIKLPSIDDIYNNKYYDVTIKGIKINKIDLYTFAIYEYDIECNQINNIITKLR